MKVEIPFKLISEKMPSFEYKEYGMGDIDEILKMIPGTMHCTGGRIWDRYVTNNPEQDPMALMADFSVQNPAMYKSIEAISNKTELHDIYFCFGTSSEFIDVDVCQFCLAHLSNNEFYVADVCFQNPNEPIPSEDKKNDFHNYKGFGILTLVFDSVKELAKAQGIVTISLMAATKDHIPLFESYGFVVENTKAAEIGLAQGVSIPMSLDL